MFFFILLLPLLFSIPISIDDFTTLNDVIKSFLIAEDILVMYTWKMYRT